MGLFCGLIFAVGAMGCKEGAQRGVDRAAPSAPSTPSVPSASAVPIPINPASPKRAARAEDEEGEAALEARLVAAARRAGPRSEAFVALLRSHLGAPAGAARDARACAGAEALRIAAIAMRREQPLGADLEELERVNSEVVAAGDQLAWDCQDENPADRALHDYREAALRLLMVAGESPLFGGSWRRESELRDEECSPAKRRARRRRSRTAAHLLEGRPSMQECRGLPSAEAVCQCLAQRAPAGATCELAELRTARARLAYVRHQEDGADVVAGTLLYLIASTGAVGAPAWSALALADSSAPVDLNETPRMSSSVELVHFQELPLAAGTLFWVQSQNDVTDHSAGDYEERGEASLLLCTIPARATGAGTCYPPLRLGQWSRSTREFADDDGREDAKACTADVTAYRFQLEASGRGALTLVRGQDPEKRAGTYQLR